MTPLRQRFVHDLQLRNYAPKTISCYVDAVARFAAHFGLSPEQLGPEHTRLYQLHLLERRVSWSGFNQAVCALRFLYRVTLRAPFAVDMIPYGKKPKTLPAVEENGIDQHACSPCAKAIGHHAYAAHRVSDVRSAAMTCSLR